MLAAQRGQPERAVLVVVARRVLLPAGTEHADVEHPDAAGEYAVAAEPRHLEPADDLGAHVAEPRARA